MFSFCQATFFTIDDRDSTYIVQTVWTLCMYVMPSPLLHPIFLLPDSKQYSTAQRERPARMYKYTESTHNEKKLATEKVLRSKTIEKNFSNNDLCTLQYSLGKSLAKLINYDSTDRD
jgi:hypothetical protein